MKKPLKKNKYTAEFQELMRESSSSSKLNRLVFVILVEVIIYIIWVFFIFSPGEIAYQIIINEYLFLFSVYAPILILLMIFFHFRNSYAGFQSKFERLIKSNEYQLVWVYPRKTTYKVYAVIPVATNFEICFCFYPHNSLTIAGGKLTMDQWYELIRENFPKVVFGYSPVLQDLYSTNIEKFLESLE